MLFCCLYYLYNISLIYRLLIVGSTWRIPSMLSKNPDGYLEIKESCTECSSTAEESASVDHPK